MKARVPQATARLQFRCWREDDLALAVSIWADPEVTAFIGGPFAPAAVRARVLEEIALAEEHGIQYWPIFLRSEGRHVGCCGLRPYDLARGVLELGIHLSPRYWGQGLAHEAAAGVIAHAFDELRADAVFAGHHPDHHASRKLIRRLGFHYTHDERYPATGRMHPSYILRAALYDLRPE